MFCSIRRRSLSPDRTSLVREAARRSVTSSRSVTTTARNKVEIAAMAM
jgi:hypothetical protein